MSTTPADLENSIHMALEAAAAANDTAEDVARLASDVNAAAGRLDRWGKQMKPVMLGVAAGAVLAVGLGGLIYMRTLSEMRTATATHIEALAVFSKSMAEVQTQMAGLAALQTEVASLAPAQEAGLARIDAALAEQLARHAETMTAAIPTEDPAASQMLRGVVEAVEGQHKGTRDAFTAGLSDLQLAMTRMLAEELPVKATVAKSASPEAKSPRKSASASTGKSKPKAAPKPAPNPFKFP